MTKAAHLLDAADERLWNPHSDLDLFTGKLEIPGERLRILLDMDDAHEGWAILAHLA